MDLGVDTQSILSARTRPDRQVMKQTLVLNVVGLTPALLPSATHLSRLAARGGMRPITTVTPAVTTTVQSTFLSGLMPQEHGIIGNGWYFRDLAEVLFWRQSNRLVAGEMVWDAAKRRDREFTCAQLFWWYNMYASVDWSVTPRPLYPADGRKLPDLYSEPQELRHDLQRQLGQFPLFHFWGPAADISSSRWISNCALDVLKRFKPTLTLVYLPHLDYNLQRLGPADPRIRRDVEQVDQLCGELIEAAGGVGAHVVVLSEYGITSVSRAIHINRYLRQAGYLRVREELGREQLDPGASRAFAVADHQIAHIYVRDAVDVAQVSKLVQQIPGVECVLGDEGKWQYHLNHERSGELVAIAEADSWFTYYHFLDDNRAPDFARTVDIHRKPGYDPVELLIDPSLRAPKLRIMTRLLRKRLGMRYLMDVISLDATLVKGSHGRRTDRAEDGPLLITSAPEFLGDGPIEATAVKALLLNHIFGPSQSSHGLAKVLT